MGILRVYVCGRLAIESQNHQLLERDLPARQGRLIWSYLVVNRHRPIGRLELADALWGDEIPDGWDPILNGIMSRLRSSLRTLQTQDASLRIDSDGGRYILSMPSGTFVDRDRARAGLHTAESSLANGDLDVALSESRVSMEIAARGFLEGETSPWIEGQRRMLHEVRIHAWECTIAAELSRANFQRAEREAEDLVAFDLLNEKAYQMLMIASASQGNRAAAVQAMERCRVALRNTAEIEPSAETEAILMQLIRAPTHGSAQGLFKKAANVKYSLIDAESSSQIRLATIEPPVPCNSGRLSG